MNCSAAGTATTNAFGDYLITAVPSATSYNCTAAALGYATKTKSVTVSAGNTTTATFNLVRLSIHLLMRVLPKEAS